MFLLVWSAPEMTVGRLLFAAWASAWVVFTVFRFEEPDLVSYIGDDYRRYQKVRGPEVGSDSDGAPDVAL